MSNRTIMLTRHGETHWNTVRRIQGHLDSPLTTFGETQAIWLRDRLLMVEIDIIYTSPLLRAFNTAKIIAGNRQIPIVTCDDLKEINLGSWEGLLLDEVNAKNPEENYNFWNKPENYIPLDGESFQALRARSERFYTSFILDSPYKNILVVTHAIALKSMITLIQERPISTLWSGAHIQPTSLTQATMDDVGIHFDFIGDISHHQSKSTDGGWFEEK